MQTRDPLRRKTRGLFEWANAGAKQSFGGVDVAEPEDLRLIQQQSLECAAGASQSCFDISQAKIFAEGFGRKLADSFCRTQSSSFDQLHHSELSLIAENQTPIILEIENRVGMLRQGILGSQIKKLAGHPQMH